jgi:SagB-type dehydrogenase family enzyme
VSGADLYELFWENSKLNAATAPTFNARIASHAGFSGGSRPFEFATADLGLERPTDALAELMDRRRSERSFSDKPVSRTQLGRVCAAFMSLPGGSRTFPSAGATYPVEIFCLLNNVEGALGRRAVYYNHDRHALSVVGEIPSWEEYADAVNIETVGVPQLLFVFVLVPGRTTHKYGERGGRFALIEVGHAAQNLALRLEQEGMVGCLAGGLYDDTFTGLLGLGRTEAHVALGYVCGLPPGPSGGRQVLARRLRFRVR